MDSNAAPHGLGADTHAAVDRSHVDLDPDVQEKKAGGDGYGSPGLFGPSESLRNADGSSLQGGEDVLALQDLDPALNMKMHLVNNVSDVSRACESIRPDHTCWPALCLSTVLTLPPPKGY